ncbi:MAG TPA: cupredoxin family copper-binding protein [Stellaceae bacterium]|nr:cupredoxin family copper-binding protein [Stellaceae bacterium]
MLMFWLGRRIVLGLLAVAALMLVAGELLLSGSVAAATEQVSVAIDNFAFGPATITVKRGTKVTWTNKDDEPHTVVAAGDDKLWRSPPLDTDDSFSFVFDKAGTYKYFCTIHPRMQGTVVVK